MLRSLTSFRTRATSNSFVSRSTAIGRTGFDGKFIFTKASQFSTKAGAIKRSTRAWNKGFEELRKFKNKHGHAIVPFRFVMGEGTNQYRLGGWVSRQRKQYELFLKNEPSLLTSDRVNALEELGFQWEAARTPKTIEPVERVKIDIAVNWTEHFDELKRYREKHGDCNVKATNSNSSLAKWVQQQRRQYNRRIQGKASSLTDEEIVALEELGFVWDPKDADLKKLSWEEWFRMLQEYESEHGDCLVPPNGGNKLGKWVNYQRKLYKLRNDGLVLVPSLTSERVEALDSLHFQWERPKRRTWVEWLDMLREYKVQHGDCHVSGSFGPLRSWITRQRRCYRLRQEGKATPLTEEKILQLEELGFEWAVSSKHRTLKENWNERLNELNEYRQKYGNCLVPGGTSKKGIRNNNVHLGRWVRSQRQQYKRWKQGKPSTMTSEKIEALEDLGFEWVARRPQSIKETTWKEWRRKLAAYKKEHGDCRPSRGGINSSLADWVDRQRYQYQLWRRGKQSEMTAEMISSLLELGFEWDIQESGTREKIQGVWDPSDPLGWTFSLGKRSAKTEENLRRLVQLQPGDPGYFDVSETSVPNVSIIRTKDQAKTALECLTNASSTVLHACDVDVMNINLKKEGPVGNGYVISMSIYSGPDFDYGLGDGPGAALWIDNLDDSYGIVREFKTWLEDAQHVKVWHNYGFGRHLLWNEGINCAGFGGDIMHLARLEDTRRAIIGNRAGYSLDGLMSEILKIRKPSMKQEFGVQVATSDGRTDATNIAIPPVEVMQRDPRFREKWIKNSCFETKCIWELRNELQRELEKMSWFGLQNMYDYYSSYMKPFGSVLTEMERRGIRLDTENLMSRVEEELQNDRKKHVIEFRRWASSKVGPDGWALEPENSEQLRTFLFGQFEERTVFNIPYDDVPFEDMSDLQLRALCRSRGLDISGKRLQLLMQLGLNSTDAWNRIHVNEWAHNEREKRFVAQRARLQEDKWDKHLNDLREYLVTHGHCHVSSSTNSSLSNWISRQRGEYWRRAEGKSSSMTDERIAALEELRFEWAVRESTAAEVRTPRSDCFDVAITSLGMPAEKLDSDGEASVAIDVLRKLAGNPFREKYGSAYDFFGGGKNGHEACVALHSLCEIDVINRHKTSFWTHLKSLADDQSRVHCSINLNTETGSVSSRRPALDNQPPHLVRKVFQASPGNNLIVANYRQLEFRLVASMADCGSMIRLFQEGGDIHARTACEMFDHVRKAVKEESCLLEWDLSRGEPEMPLLNDMFPNERQIAKDLNFLVLAGEPLGTISRQTGVPQTTISTMIESWHESYPEVAQWQLEKKAFVQKHGVARTLLGRYRHLRDSNGRLLPKVSGRASIKTPIDGSVADLSMLAMLELSDNDLLRRLGWVLLMQMNNEVLLEGPQETAEVAFIEVKRCMQKQWGFVLKNTPVPMEVDGSYKHQNWFLSKED